MTGCGEAKDTGQGTGRSTTETVAGKSDKEDSGTMKECHGSKFARFSTRYNRGMVGRIGILKR